MLWVAGLAVWAIGAVAVYRMDGDPRATGAERLQYSAAWPVFAMIIAILFGAWCVGKVYRLTQSPTIPADRLAE